jgi:chromosomal replication initiation ATPase DnaA
MNAPWSPREHIVPPAPPETVLSLWRGPILVRRPTQTPAQTRRDILATAAREYGISAEEMLSTGQTRPKVRARQTAAYMLRCERTANGEHRYSFSRIAAILGYDDPTTVLHGIRKIMAVNGWPAP